jgi:hypothetical protein
MTDDAKRQSTQTGLAPLALAFLAIWGCVSLGRQYEGARLPTGSLAEVHAGVTTKADILARFGAPTTIQRRDIEGLLAGVAARYQGQNLTIKLDPALLEDVYIYEYRRVNRTLFFSGFFNWAKSVDKSDRLVFFFDHEGKVAGYGLTEGTKEL